MAEARPLLNLFSGGELSPLLGARVDVSRYAAGCQVFEGFLPMVQGPATRRPGLTDMGALAAGNRRAWCSVFSFGATDHYLLEWGHQKLRFWTTTGLLLNGGNPYEVATPYTEADLVTAEGTFALQFHQEGDTLYIAHAGRVLAPRKLQRRAATNWSLTVYDPAGGPWAELDPSDTTIEASEVSGEVTLWASSPIFLAGHVGGLIRLFMPPSSDNVKPWEALVSVSLNEQRRSDGKIYKALESDTTGSSRPVHEDGTGSDGDVLWSYIHSGFGWARITARTSSTEVTAEVLSRLPDEVTDPGTRKWQFGAWSAAYGYPSMVGAAFGRLAFARGRQRWFTQPDDFENMRDRQAGRVTAGDAITLTSRALGEPQWMQQLENGLVIGTERGERRILKLTSTEPFGPGNVDEVPSGSTGSRRVRPVLVNGVNLFFDRRGRRLVGALYDSVQEGFKVTDHMVMAEHVLRRAGAVSMAWQGDPLYTLWVVTADGRLLGFTYLAEHEVSAWHRHPLPAGAVAECLATIPGATGDELWVFVRLGVHRRACRLAELWLEGDDRREAFLVDLGATYRGPPSKIITGLPPHLEDRVVAIMADGRAHPNRQVQGGQVTLARASSVVHVGLDYGGRIRKANVEAGATKGTAQTAIKRAHKVAIRLAGAANVWFGPSFEQLEQLDRRPHKTPLGEPTPLMSGDYELWPWPGGYDRTDAYCIEVRGALPCTMLGLVPTVQVNE